MKNLLKALHKVKSEMGGVKKDSSNPFFRSKYADLNSHLELIEPLLDKNGVVLLQPCRIVDGKNTVTTILLHVESGESIDSTMQVIGDLDMQKLGSGVTYARRYTLGSLLGMQAVDDDGEASVRSDKTPVKGKDVVAVKVATPPPTSQPVAAKKVKPSGGIDF